MIKVKLKYKDDEGNDVSGLTELPMIPFIGQIINLNENDPSSKYKVKEVDNKYVSIDRQYSAIIYLKKI